MIVNVHTRRGHTYQFASRGDLQRLLVREADAEDATVNAFVRAPGDDHWFPVRMTRLRYAAIYDVVAADDEAKVQRGEGAIPDAVCDGLPARDMAEERLRRWQEKQEVAA